MRARTKKNPSDLLCYSLSREVTQGGYTIDTLTICELRAESTAERLAGTVRNRDGYRSPADAARMGKVWEDLIGRDYREILESYSFSGERHFSFRFQVYEHPQADRPCYCEPRIDFPEKLHSAEWAIALLWKIGARMEKDTAAARNALEGETGRAYPRTPNEVSHTTFQQLQDVTATLETMGAIRFEWIKIPDPESYYPHSYRVRFADAERERERIAREERNRAAALEVA